MLSRSAKRANQFTADFDEDWVEPKKPKRDVKKALLVLGLGTLSWVATYVGMLELIQANMGNLDFVTKIVVGFSVAMLMTMIIWLLDQLFAPHALTVKLSYFVGYVFLTIISVGFGFGFYWKVLESRSEASRSAESAVSQVQASLLAGSARLDQLQTTLEQLSRISQEKAVIERDRGTSCPDSRPGDGPRRRLRDDDAARFDFASNFVKGRATKVKSDMRGLDIDLKKIASADPSTFDKATGTRNAFLQALSRKLELTATSFNAFRTDPQLRQIRSELGDRANRSTFPTGKGNATFSCPDSQLQSALFGVVKAIDQLPELGKPEIATVEGAQAVVEAFRRLTATGLGLLAFKLPPSADELRQLQSEAVRSVAPTAANRRPVSNGGLSQGGLSQRDYIPLAIAAFVDLCLLLVSIGRPMNRLGGLVPKMREAERGPVYQILSKFDDIHRDEKIREKFEVFRHVVFDFNGDYYVAVPLDAPRNRNPDEVKNLQLEAHLLANLFASFEKEKIFARIYNPLLSRKTIQKKLWRQGSKFASSQAFRTYRFRDGAWSDIILGAVMGAARRATAERRRQAEEAGPQLDMPATAGPDLAELERAREIIARAVEQQTASARKHLSEPPLPVTPEPANLGYPRDTRQTGNGHRTGAAGHVYPTAHADPGLPDETELDAAFGPYAGHVREVAPAPPVPPAMSWPYQKPPADPEEADVDLMPANSNTSPSRLGLNEQLAESGLAPREGAAGDNVIVMPLPHATAFEIQPGSEMQLPSTGNPATTDAHAPHTPPPLPPLPSAIIEREEPASPSAEIMAQTASAEPVTPLARTHPVRVTSPLRHAEPEARTLTASMNVRITQRTAEYQIPIAATANGRPVEFMRTGMNAAFADAAIDAATEDADQLALEFGSPNRESADWHEHGWEPPAADVTPEVQTARPDETTTDAERPVMLLEPRHDEIDDAEFISVVSTDEFSDDDLEQISRRFAPNA